MDDDVVVAVSVDAFIERTRDTDLVEVSIHSGPDHISAKNDEGAISNESLRGVTATFGGSAEVAQAIVGSRTGRVTVGLPERSGTGKTQSKVHMADLLATTIPLVVDVPDEVLEGIKALLAYDDDTGQIPLGMFELEAGVSHKELPAPPPGIPTNDMHLFFTFDAFTEDVTEIRWDSPSSDS